MSNLQDHVKSVDDTIRQFVEQISDGVDDPIVDDQCLDEWPLELIGEIGRCWAVTICTGGPHIEVTADGQYAARLEGYWGDDRYTLCGEYLDTFLDHLLPERADQ